MLKPVAILYVSLVDVLAYVHSFKYVRLYFVLYL